MTSNKPAESDFRPTSGEPSLGPACVTISILALGTFAILCSFGSWLAFSNQPKMAVQSIENQLIPWIDGSQLALEDRQAIILQLKMLVGELKAEKFDSHQLSRLHNCLQDNPVLLWGGIQSMENQAQGAGLTETEIGSLRRLDQRLLRSASERKLGRRDLEFTLQEVAEVRSDRSNLVVRDGLSAEQIRSFMTRADSLVSQYNIPNEPYEKTPAETFELLVQSALMGDGG